MAGQLVGTAESDGGLAERGATYVEHDKEEGAGTTGESAEGGREEEEPAACGMNEGLG